MVKLRRPRRPEKQPQTPSDADLDTVAKAIAEVASSALGQPVELAEGPEPALVGYGPDVYRFSLAAADPPWAGALLARCTEPDVLEQEANWIRAVRAAGFPAPEPLAHQPGQGALVLPEPPGKTLLESMVTDMTKVPQLLATLGQLHARLHNLPAEDVDVGEGAPGDQAPAGGTDEEPEATNDTLAEELAWLDSNEPSVDRTVVCHGELHPGHVFVDPDDTSSAVLFNWTSASLAEPERDVAGTITAFWFSPYYLDNVMYRKGLEMARDSLVSGYLNAYGETAIEPLDEDKLRYWQAFQVASLATDLDHHIEQGPSGPWDPMTAVIKHESTLKDLRKRFWELTRT